MAETKTFHAPHRHNYYMLLLATSGEGSQLIDFKSYRINPGMVFLMHPGMIHAWEWDKDLKGILVFFTADFFTQRYNDHNLLEFSFFNNHVKEPFVQFDDTQASAMQWLFEQMLEEYQRNGKKMVSALRSLLNIILIRCERLSQKDAATDGKDLQAKLLTKTFQQKVDQHFKERKLVRDYSELLHISPNYLNMVVKEVTGKPAGVFIRERIMLEAKRMLSHEERTVAEIAFDLNFKDSAYFCRFFKKYEGISPNKFKKQIFN